MRMITKIKRKLNRLIYGRGFGPIPSIARLQIKTTRNIRTWKVKYIKRPQMYRLLGCSWFLVNSYYANPKILIKGEIGANVRSRTRYVLKK